MSWKPDVGSTWEWRRDWPHWWLDDQRRVKGEVFQIVGIVPAGEISPEGIPTVADIVVYKYADEDGVHCCAISALVTNANCARLQEAPND